MNGRNSDGGNWSQSHLKNGLEKNTLNLPDPAPLPAQNYLRDDACPLTAYMTKTYPQKNLRLEKCIFNDRLSRMRCLPENAFDILANCWRVFRKQFLLEQKVKAVTLAVLTLHNWLRKESDIVKVYFSQTLVNRKDPETGEVIKGSWRKEIPTGSWKSLSTIRAHNPANKAKQIREEFTDYFTNEVVFPGNENAQELIFKQ